MVRGDGARDRRQRRDARTPTVAKVSVVGLGMRSHAGVAARMFEVLAAEGINIQMISTSEIKISVVIDAKYAELAVRVLHEALIEEAGAGGVTRGERRIHIYDTTLRDGCQAEDIALHASRTSCASPSASTTSASTTSRAAGRARTRATRRSSRRSSSAALKQRARSRPSARRGAPASRASEDRNLEQAAARRDPGGHHLRQDAGTCTCATTCAFRWTRTSR